MESLGKYILTVSAAAILFAIVRQLLSEKSAAATLIKLIGGLFLTFTAISPLSDIKLDTILEIPLDYSMQGGIVAAQGHQITQSNLQGIIKQQSESYILDKALAYQTVMDVDVTLSQGDLPVPIAVRLTGAISPYAKHILQQLICDDLGIPKENQLWIE